MNVAPLVLGEVRSAMADAQLLQWTWPSPMDVEVAESRHMLEMSIPPYSVEGAASFPEIAPGRFSHMGRMFLRPAGVALRTRSAGGRIRVVRCAIDPDRFVQTVGEEIAWTEPALRASLHLRSDKLAGLFESIRAELETPGLASDALVEAYSIALVIEAARLLGRELHLPSDGRLTAWQHRRVAERIEQPGAPPSVAELAALCGVSPRHLLRLYRNLTGSSVLAQVQAAQVRRAKDLLLRSDLPLKGVAAELGFARAGSFSTAFQRATGVTPRAFRQRRGDAGSG
jgi:AraC family transcriptional regulator